MLSLIAPTPKNRLVSGGTVIEGGRFSSDWGWDGDFGPNWDCLVILPSVLVFAILQW